MGPQGAPRPTLGPSMPMGMCIPRPLNSTVTPSLQVQQVDGGPVTRSISSQSPAFVQQGNPPITPNYAQSIVYSQSNPQINQSHIRPPNVSMYQQQMVLASGEGVSQTSFPNSAQQYPSQMLTSQVGYQVVASQAPCRPVSPAQSSSGHAIPGGHTGLRQKSPLSVPCGQVGQHIVTPVGQVRPHSCMPGGQVFLHPSNPDGQVGHRLIVPGGLVGQRPPFPSGQEVLHLPTPDGQVGPPTPALDGQVGPRHPTPGGQAGPPPNTPLQTICPPFQDSYSAQQQPMILMSPNEAKVQPPVNTGVPHSAICSTFQYTTAAVNGTVNQSDKESRQVGFGASLTSTTTITTTKRTTAQSQPVTNVQTRLSDDFQKQKQVDSANARNGHDDANDDVRGEVDGEGEAQDQVPVNQSPPLAGEVPDDEDDAASDSSEPAPTDNPDELSLVPVDESASDVLERQEGVDVKHTEDSNYSGQPAHFRHPGTLSQPQPFAQGAPALILQYPGQHNFILSPNQQVQAPTAKLPSIHQQQPEQTNQLPLNQQPPLQPPIQQQPPQQPGHHPSSDIPDLRQQFLANQNLPLPGQVLSTTVTEH